jgi:hypothetical protein
MIKQGKPKLVAAFSGGLTARRIVPLSDQMRLRYLARRDEVTLLLAEIARRILARERDAPMKSRQDHWTDSVRAYFNKFLVLLCYKLLGRLRIASRALW